MNWSEQRDYYCERTDLSYWSEPMNAVSNGAFLVAAAWMWRRCSGVVWARVLCAILFVIGIGLFLFHTHATRWAELADVVPIATFILVYLFLVNSDVVGMRWWWAVLATLGFAPYAYVMVPILDSIPFIRISDFYWAVPILLLFYAALLRRRFSATARGLAIGALILCVSITIRSLDQGLCANWPIGTHFIWHILNATMFGWMIEVYRRHVST
ncbi:MAG: hypothetical protein P8Q26_00190 [Ascidiaceihabitans sp.]|nr:hypothetical protein [Ascidiaceihabitans sp.]